MFLENNSLSVIIDNLISNEKEIYYYGEYLDDVNILYKLKSTSNKLSLPNSIFYEDLMLLLNDDSEYAQLVGIKKYTKQCRKRYLNSFKTGFYDEILSLKIDNQKRFYQVIIKHIVLPSGSKASILNIRNVHKTGNLYEELIEKSYKCPLTKLFNRNTLKRHLEKRTTSMITHYVYIDIDGFKKYNDTYGHDTGDLVLSHFGRAVLKTFGDYKKDRSHDIIAYRIAGDEFFLTFIGKGINIVHSTISDINREFQIYNNNGIQLNLSFSYGVLTVEPNEVVSSIDILTKSDKIMYDNKNSKKLSAA